MTKAEAEKILEAIRDECARQPEVDERRSWDMEQFYSGGFKDGRLAVLAVVDAVLLQIAR